MHQKHLETQRVTPRAPGRVRRGEVTRVSTLGRHPRAALSTLRRQRRLPRISLKNLSLTALLTLSTITPMTTEEVASAEGHHGPAGTCAQEYMVMRHTFSDKKLYGHETASQYGISDLNVR
jgi:hypothetical protein